MTSVLTGNLLPALKTTPRYLNVSVHDILSSPSYILTMFSLEAGPITEHEDFETLNLSNRLLLTWLQKSSIDCRPVTDADSTIKSSAYIIQPRKCD